MARPVLFCLCVREAPAVLLHRFLFYAPSGHLARRKAARWARQTKHDPALIEVTYPDAEEIRGLPFAPQF